MKKYMLLTLSALLALLVAVACAPTGGQEPAAVEPTDAAATTEEPTTMEPTELQGVRWMLSSYTDAAGQMAVALTDREVTAEFGSDGQLAGSGGCNNYFASYTVEGNNLTIGPAGSTMMACEPAEIMQQEAAFLTALSTAASWQRDGEQLTILNAAGETVVTFQAAAPQTLSGTNWSAVNINVGTAVTGLLADTSISLTFGEDGQLSGNGGCNQFFGSYTVDGDNLTLGEIGQSAMACEPAEVMEQETQFLTSLAKTATWRMENGQLWLRNEAGEIVAVLDPVDATSLTGQTWLVTNYNNGREAVVSTLADTTLTATFGEDGNLNGSAGCNNFMTSYTLDGANITISPAATTRKMCPGEGVMEQEAQFLAALQSAATWSITGDKLEMRTAGDALALVLVPQPVQ